MAITFEESGERVYAAMLKVFAGCCVFIICILLLLPSLLTPPPLPPYSSSPPSLLLLPSLLTPPPLPPYSSSPPSLLLLPSLLTPPPLPPYSSSPPSLLLLPSLLTPPPLPPYSSPISLSSFLPLFIFLHSLFVSLSLPFSCTLHHFHNITLLMSLCSHNHRMVPTGSSSTLPLSTGVWSGTRPVPWSVSVEPSTLPRPAPGMWGTLVLPTSYTSKGS